MPDYFTLTELRAMPHMGDATKYAAARVEAAAAYIVGIFEREVGTAFVTRTVTAEIHDGGHDVIVLDHADAVAVTAITVDGVAASTSGLTVNGGILQATTGGAPWAAGGPGGVSVTYTHGYSTAPPADVKEAALIGTRAHLLATAASSATDARRTSMSTESGTINYAVAGGDNPTGYPEVDSVIVAWRNRLGMVGFA